MREEMEIRGTKGMYNADTMKQRCTNTNPFLNGLKTWEYVRLACVHLFL